MRTDELVRLQALLGEALTAPDPATYWREHLPERALDEAGLRIAALLVAKLRFERLMSASPRAGEWFARDAAEFTAAFRRYHHGIVSKSLDPWGEAASFDAWCSQQPGGGDA